MYECLIAFGSNEGNRQEAYLAVVQRLNQTRDLQVTATSTLLVTDAVGSQSQQPEYLNGAIGIETSIEPARLHQRLIEIENELGRVRRERWGSRTIDLDLLLYGQEQVDTENLVVPHPRMSFRRFVLEPASEIAGHLIHPPSGQTLQQLVSRLNEADDLVLCVGGHPIEEFLPAIAVETEGDSSPPWELRSIKSLEKYREFQMRAKLVVYHRPTSREIESNDVITPLLLAASSFSGATLQLPPNIDEAKLELLAAIEAMKPLR